MSIDKELKQLEEALQEIWDIGHKFGLDPYPTKFEMVPATVMYEIGSYALPGRYSHWTFGKAYHRMKTMYDFGLSKIYEVVINTNPSYGFLLETNSPIQNKLVMAHVMGHVDFFKNNVYFSKTNRRMVETVSTHSGRMMEYEFKYGRKTVEKFLDSILSIEEHIDPDLFIRREISEEEKRERKKVKHVDKPYDDLLSMGEKKEAKPAEAKEEPRGARVPEKDILYFIMHNSPILEDWQRDVIAMIHEEMEYFIPQMQTKIMNEGWACATGETLILTENGFIRFDSLYNSQRRFRVASGRENEVCPIEDFHKEERVPTLRLRTRRGLSIEGAHKHKVLTRDGSWKSLVELKAGDVVSIQTGTNIWPKNEIPIREAVSQRSATLHTVAALAGLSVSTVMRHMKGRRTRHGAGIDLAIKAVQYRSGIQSKVLRTRHEMALPESLTKELAWLMGIFVGDGNRTKSGICITSGNLDHANKIATAIEAVLGLRAYIKWDKHETGGRWRVIVHSRDLMELFEFLGIRLCDRARMKKIPQTVLMSPKHVVSSFLRGLFDADAYAGKEGVRFSSSSHNLIGEVQQVLLNFGILSTQRRHIDDCYQLEITGHSAKLFLEEVGFSLEYKYDALRNYVDSHKWFKKEKFEDEIVSIEEGFADVFDITVGKSHAYVGNGFINHNSYWHARIMREMNLSDTELLEFAELHSGVVSPHKGQLNPYYLGYKIFEDIEKRWDKPTEEDRSKYGRKGGEGREKIFEVRELDNDVSFLRNYLTEELCEELDLFVYELVEEEEWRVTEKRWERVRDQLVANMTNFGFPYIVVEDGDYNRNHELYLKHRFEGAELDSNYARRVLEYVYRLWGRPVHLETIVDDEKMIMHYDGADHDED
jgi:stage V sporulation protein R